MHSKPKRARLDAQPSITSTAIATFWPVPATHYSLNITNPKTSLITSDIESLALQLQLLRIGPPQDTASVHGKRKHDYDDHYGEEQETVSAPEQALSTFELVENILVHADARDILRMQATNSVFKDVYRRSKCLQLKTLEHIDSTHKPDAAIAHHNNAQLNPVLITQPLDSTDQPLFGLLSYQLARPQGVEYLMLTSFAGKAPILYMTLEEASEDPARKLTSSLTKLFIFDSATTFTLSVDHGMINVHCEHGPDIPISLTAEVTISNCKVGQALRIAQQLRVEDDLSFVTTGDHRRGIMQHTAEHAQSFMDQDLLDLVVGKVTLRAYMGL